MSVGKHSKNWGLWQHQSNSTSARSTCCCPRLARAAVLKCLTTSWQGLDREIQPFSVLSLDLVRLLLRPKIQSRRSSLVKLSGPTLYSSFPLGSSGHSTQRNTTAPPPPTSLNPSQFVASLYLYTSSDNNTFIITISARLWQKQAP